MELEQSLKSLLKSTCSVDVDALYIKYSSQRRKSSSHIASSPREKNDTASESNPDNKANSALDDLVMCNRCNGLGLMKQTYNNQIRDINCTNCEAEGILWRHPDGTLKYLSQRPKTTTTKVTEDDYSQILDQNHDLQADSSLPPDLV